MTEAKKLTAVADELQLWPLQVYLEWCGEEGASAITDGLSCQQGLTADLASAFAREPFKANLQMVVVVC